jgi:hypothetical protein
MKKLENSKEAHDIFFGNIYCDISAASGAPDHRQNKMASQVQKVWVG